jgi:TetR/AcrR family transcriptional regulator, transcriptional repressor for nem operon
MHASASPPTTRELIIAAADRHFYEHGFENTSFADIASSVEISRGNFYYHFKSKDEILDAVIAERIESTRDLLERWEAKGPTPIERIRCFIHILVDNRRDIKQYGCPVGSLCTELAKLNHASKSDAVELFSLFRSWLRNQFGLLGRTADADRLAMHLLSRSQGVATLATAFADDRFVDEEVRQLCAWLDAIAAETARSSKPPRRERRSS